MTGAALRETRATSGPDRPTPDPGRGPGGVTATGPTPKVGRSAASPPFWTRWVLAMLSLVSACARETTHAGTDARPELDGGQPDAARECAVDVVVSFDGDQPSRAYALARHRGADVALVIDTASQVTFLSTPPGSPDVPDFDELILGCETLRAYGRPISRAEESELAGFPVVGFLGADYFQSTPTRLDLAARRLTRVDRAEIAPSAAPMPYHDVFGYMFVEADIDDTSLLLGFDTGAMHTLWVGVDGRPGDLPLASVDGFGTPITLHLGWGWMRSAGLEREVPVLRIREHASIEASDAALGVDADGLFGLSSLPGSSFVVDAERHTIWLE